MLTQLWYHWVYSFFLKECHFPSLGLCVRGFGKLCQKDSFRRLWACSASCICAGTDGWPQQSLLRCVTGELAMGRLDNSPQRRLCSQSITLSRCCGFSTHLPSLPLLWCLVREVCSSLNGRRFPCLTAERTGLRLKPGLSGTAAQLCWGGTAALLFWHPEGETLLRLCRGFKRRHLLRVWGSAGAIQEGNIWAIRLSHAVSVRHIWMLSTYHELISPRQSRLTKRYICPRAQSWGVTRLLVTPNILLCRAKWWTEDASFFIHFLVLHRKTKQNTHKKIQS